MIDLSAAIAECLALHAEAMDKLGTDHPELDPRVPPEFRDKITRQWAKVSASLEGDPEVHLRHVEALNKGVRIILHRLAPTPPKPPPPPLPIWNDESKKWVVLSKADRDAYVAELAETFDRRTPDDPNNLFREGEKT